MGGAKIILSNDTVTLDQTVISGSLIVVGTSFISTISSTIVGGEATMLAALASTADKATILLGKSSSNAKFTYTAATGAVTIFTDTNVAAALTINPTSTPSTSTSTGNLVIPGGLGVGGTVSASILNVPLITSVINQTTANPAALTSTYTGTDSQFAFKFLEPNLAAFEFTGLIVGQAASTYNSATIDFVKVSTGSSANQANFGLFGGASIGCFSNQILTSNQFRVSNTTASTSISTGSARFDGGVGIAGDVYIGGSITSGAASVTNLSVSGTSTFTNTTAATSITTGSITTLGGLGVSGDIFAKGIYLVDSTQTNIYFKIGHDVSGNYNAGYLGFNYTSADSLSNQISFGFVITGNNIETPVFVIGRQSIKSTLPVIVSNTTASNSITTGSLTTLGGIGVSGDIFAKGTYVVDPSQTNIYMKIGHDVSGNFNAGYMGYNYIGNDSISNQITLGFINTGNTIGSATLTLGRLGTSISTPLIVSGAGTFTSLSTNGSQYFGYSEGTWSPVVKVYSGGSVVNTGTSTVFSATWVKVGRQVTIAMNIGFDIGGAPTNSLMAVTGLPYTIVAGEEVVFSSNKSKLAGISTQIYLALNAVGTTYSYLGTTELTCDGSQLVILTGNTMVYYTGQLSGSSDQKLACTMTYYV